MTLEDITNVAIDNKIQFTISIDPGSPAVMFVARKNGKKVYKGIRLEALNKRWDEHIEYELTKLFKKLEEATCST